MDFYIVLGVDVARRSAEIKRACRRLARKYHPDINPGDDAADARSGASSEAYETLIDPERRGATTRLGDDSRRAGCSRFGFAGFDFSSIVDGAQARRSASSSRTCSSRRRRAGTAAGTRIDHVGVVDAVRGSRSAASASIRAHAPGAACCAGPGRAGRRRPVSDLRQGQRAMGARPHGVQSLRRVRRSGQAPSGRAPPARAAADPQRGRRSSVPAGVAGRRSRAVPGAARRTARRPRRAIYV